MKSERYFDNREHRFDITLPNKNDPVLAVCPKCNAKVLILPKWIKSYKNREQLIRAVQKLREKQ